VPDRYFLCAFIRCVNAHKPSNLGGVVRSLSLIFQMPRKQGTANYKVDLLIDIIEEKLPQGALGWQEVAALYQFHTQEGSLRDYDDVKRH
jgi:hypothetical protein